MTTACLKNKTRNSACDVSRSDPFRIEFIAIVFSIVCLIVFLLIYRVGTATFDKNTLQWHYQGDVKSITITPSGVVDVMLENVSPSDRKAGFVDAPVRFNSALTGLTDTEKLYIQALQQAMISGSDVSLQLSDLSGGSYTLQQMTMTK